MAKENMLHEEIHIQEDIQVHFLVYEQANLLITNHWHNHLEVLYMLEGSMEVIFGNESNTLLPGQFIIINSGDIHSTKCTETVKVILLQIPYSLLKRCIPDYDYLRFDAIDSSNPKIISLLLSLKQIYEEQKEGYQLAFSSRLYEFLHILVTSYKVAVSSSSKIKTEKNLERLETLMDYVKEHYKEPISLEEAAQVVSLNPEYLCRFFKKNMGLTFSEYVNSFRLTMVHEELLSTDYTITEILSHQGVTNYHLFSKMFKETYGCTPLQKRKESALLSHRSPLDYSTASSKNLRTSL